MIAAALAVTTFFVSPAWVSDAQAAKTPLVVLHVGTQADYDAGHVPGAQLITLRDLSDPDAKLTLQMASIERLRAAFEARGVTDASRIVVYWPTSSVQSAARVFVALDVLGLGDRASLLDGGLAGWKAAGKPVVTEASAPVAGSLTPKPQPSVIVDTAWVKARMNGPTTIVDARAPGFYTGAEKGNFPRHGHIVGAVNIPYDTLTEPPLLTVKSEAQLRALFEAAGVEPGGEVVTYCHIGQQASALYLAAKMLGYKVHLYDGSFEEWSNTSELPIETGEARKK
ncbi:MAG: sulfurtransferase [Vicinamibacterales bacterium]